MTAGTSWVAVHEARPALAGLLLLLPAYPLLLSAQVVPAGAGGAGLGGALAVQILLPLLAACVAAAALGRTDADVERTAARTLVPARLVWLTGLTVLVALGMLGAAASGASDDLLLTVGRNSVGLTGLAALGAVLLAADLAWLLPAAYTAVCVVAGTHQTGDLSGTARGWAWLVDTDPRHGLLLAVGCWLVGAGAYAHRGAR